MSRVEPSLPLHPTCDPVSSDPADLAGWVHRQAGRSPAAIALLAPGRPSLDYGALSRQLGTVVSALHGFGFVRGDRIALVLPGGPEAAVATLAIAAEFTCAPLDPAGRAAEFERELSALRATALIVPHDSTTEAITVARARGLRVLTLTPHANAAAGCFMLAEADAGAATEPATESPSLILHTSGTTARPKQVRLEQRHLVAAARAIVAALELTPADRCLGVMPLFHIHGLSTLFASVVAGASIICPPAFSAPRFLEWLGLQPSWYSAAPALHQAIVDEATRQAGDDEDPAIDATPPLRLVRSASSSLPGPLRDALERLFGCPVIEAYGMTEAAPQIASNRLPADARRAGSVVRPAGPEVRIIDPAGCPLAAGATGEIVVRGANVIDRYAGDPSGDGTDTGFVDGWLRTGDLGHFDPDGFLFVTGRLKELINRGGEKISPADVERALLEHPGVAQAACFGIPHPLLGEAVAAMVVPRPGSSVTASEVRRFAAARLTYFKLPQQLVVVDALPQGSTGKLDRLRLTATLGELTPARTVTEATIADVWAEVLDRDRPGMHDDFFLLGGDSLSAARIATRLQPLLGIELPMEALFTHPTVAELADLAGRLADRSSLHRPLIPGRLEDDAPPLSYAQERLWFLDRMAPGGAAYNIASSLWLSGALDATALERGLDEIRRRHATLRTTFGRVGDRPVQRIARWRAEALPVTTVADDDAALRLARAEARRPFDLAQGPLFRASLVRVHATRHALLLTTHHSVSDGWSSRLMVRELAALYAAFAAGRPSPLSDPAYQYADFARWQRGQLGDTGIERQRRYWVDRLRDLPAPLELPTDRPRPRVRTQHGARTRFVLGGATAHGLTSLATRERATRYMVVLAALQVLLGRYSGQQDFIIGTPVANRLRLETEAMIGCFANTLAIRADLSGDPSFCRLLDRVRISAEGAFAHQAIPFDQVVDAVRPTRDAARLPLVDVMFAFQNFPDGGTRRFSLAPGLFADLMDVHSEAAKFDLTLYLDETPRGLEGTWLYNTDLFDPTSIAKLSGDFTALLDAIVQDPARRIGDYPMAAAGPGGARVALGRRDDDAALLHQRVERHAARSPQALAAVCGDSRLTYAELNARAYRLARLRVRHGAGPGHCVGLALPRSRDLVIAILAVLKSGAAYLPLDPEYPAERTALLLRDATPRWLLTLDGPHARVEHGSSMTVLRLDELGVALSAESAEDLERPADPDDLAYLMYTSGSTGVPKGVMVTQANLRQCLRAIGSALDVTVQDRYLHTASFSFSSSVRQLAVALGHGATTVVARRPEIQDPRQLFDLIRRTGVTILDIVPSYWRTCLGSLATHDITPADSLRLVLSASERLPADLPAAWAARCGDGTVLVNMYGQTETTGIVTLHRIGASRSMPDAVPIGRPVADVTALVLDAALRPVPDGVPGELFIAGPGLARGYLNQPDLTAERFPTVSIDGHPLRMYRTGDRVRMNEDRYFEYLGRGDDQVKIRGHRIEPGEVEAALRRHPGVWDVAVVAQEDVGAGQRLAAFVVGRAPLPPPRLGHDLRRHLAALLPAHMVPTVIVEVDALPLTENRKIDRRALSARRVTASDDDAPPVVPADGDPMIHRGTGPRHGHDAERILMKAWQQVLQVEHVGRDDNFFDLGGDSLLSVGMVDRANAAGLAVDLNQLYQHQTLGELARVAATATTERTPAREVPIRVTLASLQAWGREALERAGLAAAGAAIVTDVQIEASLRGQATHNVDSIPRYARRVRAGALNRAPAIRTEQRSAISAQVDGDNGPGQWVATVAMEAAIARAVERGVGLVSVRRSNHFGAAAQYVWMAARRGLIGLCTTNGPVILAPTGGVTPTFGNNPLGVGIPAGRHHPILLDIAMSVAPRGRIGLQLAEGKPLPAGWILDRFGQPSTDPADLAAGLGVPIGAHKGYGLALVLEVLAGALSGSGLGTDHRREHMRNTAQARDLGHFFMAIDPELFTTGAEFRARVDRLIDLTKAGERAPGVAEILIPGESELRERERNLVRGVPLRAGTYRALLKYADEADLQTDLVLIDDPGAD